MNMSEPDAISHKSVDRVQTQSSERVGSVKAKVHFSLWAAIGQQYSITGAPLTVGTYLSLSIGVGRSPAFFWGFIVVAFFNGITCLAVAELASAFPHSSGPAHWCIVLGHPSYAEIIGYVNGWLTTAGWYFIACSSALYPAQFITAIAKVANPDYNKISTWQTYLVYVLFALLFTVLNMPRIFRIQGPLLVVGGIGYNVTAIFILISLLSRVHPKQSAHVVFVELVNETGWSSDGWVFFLALVPSFIVLAALDSPVHMSDELENPTRQVPLVMFGSFGCSVVAGMTMILVFQFCNISPESLLEPVGGQPMVEIFVNGYQMMPLTITATAMTLCCLFVSGSAAFISWSRLYWSFSRKGGLPFSGTMSKLSRVDSLPVNALLICCLLAIALGAISIGSEVAMKAFLGGASLCILSSLAASLGLGLYRGRRTFNRARWLNLGGKVGDIIHWIALLWSIFMMVIMSVPLYRPVSLSNMNWSVLVYGGIMALSGIYYVAFFSKNKLSHGDGHCDVHRRNAVELQEAVNA